MTTRTSTLLAMALTGIVLAGCDGSRTSAAVDPPALGPSTCAASGPVAQATTKVYTFVDGAKTQSRVERTVRADGSETMRGETRPLRSSSVAGGASGIPGGAVVREYAELDAAGRLVYADVSLRDEGGAVIERLILDPQRNAALVRRPGASRFVRVPADAPWSYAPLTATVTPVAAWITRRAAEAGPAVRIVDAPLGGSRVVVRDQLVVDDGRETFVVIGDSAVSADQEFITSLPLEAVDALTARTACDVGARELSHPAQRG